MKILFTVALVQLMLMAPMADARNAIIPKPREMRLGDGELIIRGGISVRPVFAKEARPLALAAEDLTFLLTRPQATGETTRVTLTSRESGAAADLHAMEQAWGSALPDKPEAYALRVTPNEIIVLGADDRGLFYGIQTLKQLVEPTADGFRAPVCEIVDWPSLAFRGAHLYTGRNALTEQKRLMDVLAGLKMNHIVLEVDFLEFKSFPELRHEPYAQSQEDVRALITHARDRYITITPQVSSLGHAEWAFTTGHHLDLAEDPEHPAAFTVTNPATYQFLFAIFDEIFALFEPEMIHIGLDEVDHFGRFPHRLEMQKYTMTEILDLYLGRIVPYFASKNVHTVMIWGDMFLAPGEAGSATNAKSLRDARARRAILHNIKRLQPPMDFVICDWHYEPAAVNRFTSLAIFQGLGLRTIASTWQNPLNIRNFAHKAIAENSLGLLQTTWAGYNFAIESLPEERRKFSAYLLAADYAWSGREEMPDDLPYFYDVEFWRRWHAASPLAGGAADLQIPMDMMRLIFSDEARVIVKPIAAGAVEGQQRLPLYELSGEVSNPFDRPAQVEGSAETPFDAAMTLNQPPRTRGQQLPGKIATLPKPATPQSLTRVNFRVTLEGMPPFEFQKEAKIAPVWHAAAPPEPVKVDGDLSDWRNVEPYVFATPEFVAIKTSWSPDDLSARLYAGQHGRKIFLAFEVTDDEHFNDRTEGWIWEGDCVQMSFDFHFDRAAFFSDGHAELGFALDNAGQVQAHVWHSPYDNPGILDVMERAVRREGNITRYEFMIPLEALGDPMLIEQDRIGFTFSINDNDGAGFTGGIIGSQGIYGEDKNPGYFGTLILETSNADKGISHD